ncbi:MAG: hypothetical protein FD143_620 [Ignavibacteria bacterium]|nr:MAG: hypothetical protein FD143_620 [Ignavibacteria bacterium]KAF0161450.1 MAG: hypothetical protein FD188_821 [Ignavibacteria bacterium]
MQLTQKFEEIVSSLGYLLIEVIIRGDRNLKVIELYIDNEKGITTDDCSLVSRAVNEAIETENFIDSNFRLDVSSPGIERPLKFLVQFQKHINRKFEIIQKDEERKLTAKLLRIEGESLFFADKGGETKIEYKNITQAKVLISL